MYRDFRDRNDVMSGVLARFPASLTLTYHGQAERVQGDLVSGNYFEVLGLQPALGRLFTQADDRTPGAHPVVVLSYGFWMRRFGGDPALLNETIALNGHPMTVVGVAPRVVPCSAWCCATSCCWRERGSWWARRRRTRSRGWRARSSSGCRLAIP